MLLDLLAVVLGIGCFAGLYAAIAWIDRV